jgi:hypothetical protein
MQTLDDFSFRFLMCKYDDWGRRVRARNFPVGRRGSTKPTEGFSTWVDVFRKHEKPGSQHDFNCYNPWNMQTRYLVAQRTSGHSWKGGPREGPQAVQAISKLENEVAFVGITEFFSASICLFQASLQFTREVEMLLITYQR